MFCDVTNVHGSLRAKSQLPCNFVLATAKKKSSVYTSVVINYMVIINKCRY